MKIANLLTMLALMDEGGGPEPTGTIEITENGTHDVAEYAEANVNVPGIVPAGTTTISSNGTHDVAQYETAQVKVKTWGTKKLTVIDNRSAAGEVPVIFGPFDMAGGAHNIVPFIFTTPGTTSRHDLIVPHSFLGGSSDFEYPVRLFVTGCTVTATTGMTDFGTGEFLLDAAGPYSITIAD